MPDSHGDRQASLNVNRGHDWVLWLGGIQEVFRDRLGCFAGSLLFPRDLKLVIYVTCGCLAGLARVVPPMEKRDEFEGDCLLNVCPLGLCSCCEHWQLHQRRGLGSASAGLPHDISGGNGLLSSLSAGSRLGIEAKRRV